jgi:hypothetical protein
LYNANAVGRFSVLFLPKENIYMRRLILLSAAMLCAGPATTLAEELKSGLEVGKSATPFNVRDITGPNAGKTLCYR